MKINKNNFPGTGSIHPRVLKEFKYDIVKLLVPVYNLAFKTAGGTEGEKPIFQIGYSVSNKSIEIILRNGLWRYMNNKKYRRSNTSFKRK